MEGCLTTTHRFLAGKERQKQLMVVHLNVVVLGRLAVDLTFDFVTEGCEI
jgi:hypothetical protein